MLFTYCCKRLCALPVLARASACISVVVDDAGLTGLGRQLAAVSRNVTARVAVLPCSMRTVSWWRTKPSLVIVSR